MYRKKEHNRLDSPLPVSRPDHCILGVALPMTKEAFMADLQENSQKDFVKQAVHHTFGGIKPSSLWSEEYYPNLVTLIDRIEEDLMQSVEVQPRPTVKRNYTLSDLKQLGDEDVLTVVAHWVEEKRKIELYDGLFTKEEFEAAIPGSFIGIIDLTICNSEELFSYIKKKRKKNNLVMGSIKKVYPELRLAFYKITMKSLRTKSQNYFDAMLDIIDEYLKGH